MDRLSDNLIPSKSILIKICKNEYRVDHGSLQLVGMPQFKDRVIMTIYVASKVQGCQNKQISEIMDQFEKYLETQEESQELLNELQTYRASLNTQIKNGEQLESQA